MDTFFNINSPASFPTGWTAPASCFASTNFYQVLIPSGTVMYFSNMFGTPTPVLTGIWPTGDCWPPSTTPNVPYLTDGGCPAGYTRACATAIPDFSGTPASAVTCCPSIANNAFSFMCRNNEYGCHGTATPGAVWTGVLTNIVQSTEEPFTHTPSPQEGLEVWGIKLLWVASASSTSTHILPTNSATSIPITNLGTTTTTTAPSPDTRTTLPATASGDQPKDTSPPRTASTASTASTAGMETATIVGVALGSAGAVALLALAAFLVYRRRHRQRAQPSSPSGGGSDTSPALLSDTPFAAVAGPKVVYQLDGENGPQMLDSQGRGPGVGRGGRVWEMPG